MMCREIGEKTKSRFSAELYVHNGRAEVDMSAFRSHIDAGTLKLGEMVRQQFRPSNKYRITIEEITQTERQ